MGKAGLKEAGLENEISFRLGEYLPFQFFIISALVCKELEKIYSGHGIESNKEWRVMAFLHDKGRMTMSEISAVSFIDPVNSTRAVENLFQKGYCDRFYDPRDRRKVEVELSAAGAKVMAGLIPELKKWETRLKKIIGDKASAEILNNFGKITEELAGDNKPKIN